VQGDQAPAGGIDSASPWARLFLCMRDTSTSLQVVRRTPAKLQRLKQLIAGVLFFFVGQNWSASGHPQICPITGILDTHATDIMWFPAQKVQLVPIYNFAYT
jgi:hypothetical protein